MLAFALAAAVAASDVPAALVERIVSGGYAPAHVYVGRKPPDLSATVPLPAATLLGSVGRDPAPATTGGSPMLSVVTGALGSAQLYYDAPDRRATVDAYTAALAKAGWTRPSNGIPQGGFSAIGGLAQTWCSADAHDAVTIGQQPGDARAIDVGVLHAASDPVSLCNLGAVARHVIGGLGGADVLPSFTEPPGVTVDRELPFFNAGATTRARLTSSLALPALFDGFARQLSAAGWTAGAVAGSPSSRLQTFTKTADGRALTAALTIYAIGPQTYMAIVDTADANGRRSSLPGVRKPL